MDEVRPRVLMLGPDRKSKGGIASVVNQFFDAGLQNQVELTYISTACDGNAVRKCVQFCFGVIKFFKIVNNVDIVHIHMASRGSYRRKRKFVVWAKQKKKKVIIHLHGAEFKIFYNEEADKKLKSDIRKILNLADKFIVLSNEWKEFIDTIVDPKKVVIVHNAVALNHKSNLKNQSIIFLGKLGKRKGVYDLIDAMPYVIKDHPDVMLLLAGDGEIEKCRKKATENGTIANIKFLGWIDSETKNKLLSESSVFVLPSYNEGLPMSMLEAMSFGLPVVVSDAGGIPAVIHDGENGLLVHAGDVNKLSVVLTEVLEDVELRFKLGQSAFDTINNFFSIDKQIKKLLNIYKTILYCDDCENKRRVL